MIIKFNKELYSKEALIKAAYRFTDRSYIHLDIDDSYYIVSIQMKSDYQFFDEEEFQNELLGEMVRMHVTEKTRNIREMILARALSSTIIEKPHEESNLGEETDINDILMDWFEKHE